MNFKQEFEKKWKHMNETFGAFMTLKEYINTRFNKIMRFITDEPTRDSTEQVLAVPTVINDVYQMVGVTKSQIQSIYDGYDGQMAVMLNDTDVANIEASQISDDIEDMLADLKAQEVFIDSVITQGADNSIGFVTNLKLRYQNISEDICAKYATIIDTAADPISALRAYIELGKHEQPDIQSTYVTINTTDYTGNVALAAICTVGQPILDWFSSIDWSWSGIKTFLNNLWDGISKLSTWVAGKLFGNLTTNYTQGSARSVGMLDVPIFQIGFAHENFPSFLASLRNAIGSKLYSADGRAYCLNLQSMSGSTTANNIADMLWHLDKDFETSASMILQFVVPGGDNDVFDIVFQLGEDIDDHFVLSAYPVCCYSDFATISDDQVSIYIHKALTNALRFMSSLVPMSYEVPNYHGTAEQIENQIQSYFSLLALGFFWDGQGTFNLDPDFPKNLVLLHATNDWFADYTYKVNNQTNTAHDDAISSFIMSALIYAIRYGRGSYIFIDQDVRVSGDSIINAFLYNPALCSYTPSDDSEVYDFTDWTPITNDDYTPYTLNSVMGVSVHYQSVNEQAKEILKLVVVLSIAIVVTVVAFKFVKYKRMRRKQGLLNQARADSLSWEYAANPTQENYNAWEQAYRKNRRYQRLNGLLGIGSDTVDSAAGSLTQSVMSLAKKTSEDASALNGGISTETQKVIQFLKIF